jgi:hypothetical protein
MRADRDFPRLTRQNHRVTSPASIEYNCIAWAAGDTENWWQPGAFWPVESDTPEYGIEALAAAFRAPGFEPCDDDGPEQGFEKVALYGNNLLYTHAARQLPGGRWTSKLGKAEDIEHDTPDVVAGGLYGEVVAIMRRPLPSDATSGTVV